MNMHDAMVSALDKARATFKARNAAYSQGQDFGFEKHAAMLMALFPEGLTIKDTKQMARFILFVMVTVKVARYAEHMPTQGHEDSAHDLGVYALLMEAYDAVMTDREGNR